MRSRLVPLATLPEAIDSLDRDREVVVCCKGGEPEPRCRIASCRHRIPPRRESDERNPVVAEEVDPTLARY